MIVCSALALGRGEAKRLKNRLETMRLLRQMVYFLKGEIVGSRAPLDEALERAGARGMGELRALFCRTAKRVRERRGESFQTLWREEVAQLGECFLTDDDRKHLISLGDHLGYLDVQMQERTILLFLEQLDFSLEEARAQLSVKCRLYTCLGAAFGLFLVILLC